MPLKKISRLAKTRGTIVLILLCLFLSGCAENPPSAKKYGVFVGLNPEDASILYDYQKVVIDAEYFSAEDIAALKERGITVLSYLNIGSVETFRDCYADFKDSALAPYENWPDEYWMDITLPAWQDYLAAEAKKLFYDKKADGFFLDNADVYYHYPADEVYQGLCGIINRLRKETTTLLPGTASARSCEILVNGGDVFISRFIADTAQDRRMISGINQECVFTDIDFDTGRFSFRRSDYLLDYINDCRKASINIYLTEYIAEADLDSKEASRIAELCERQNYTLFTAKSVNLDR